MCANVYYIMTQNYTISTNHVDNDCHFCTGAKQVPTVKFPVRLVLGPNNSKDLKVRLQCTIFA